MITGYLQAGTGYYRLNRHPLGSDYRRSPQDPEIVSIERRQPQQVTSRCMGATR